MNIRDLAYVAAVAEMGSFSGAALRCCVSQPTLSGQIKKLEAELGVQIFERNTKIVRVTELGQQIIAAAGRLLHEADAIRGLADSALDPAVGYFRLGAMPTLSVYIFPRLLQTARHCLPRVDLILVEEKTAELIAQVKSGTLDAALVALPETDATLTQIELFPDPFLLAVPVDHPLARRENISQSELRGLPVLLLDEGHCLRGHALQICGDDAAQADQSFRATSLETLRQMVRAGVGVTLMPGVAVPADDAGIRYIPFRAPAPARRIGIVGRGGNPKAAVVETLAEAMRGDAALQLNPPPEAVKARL